MGADEVHTTEFKRVFPDIKAAGFFRKPVSIEQMNKEMNKLLARPAKVGVGGKR